MRTSSKIILKFIFFSGLTLFVSLFLLNFLFFFQGISNYQKEFPKNFPNSQIFQDTNKHPKNKKRTVIDKNQNCFRLQEKEYCINNLENYFFDIIKIDGEFFLLKTYDQEIYLHQITDFIETVKKLFRLSIWIFIAYLLISYPLGLYFFSTFYKKLFTAINQLIKQGRIDINKLKLSPNDELKKFFEKINNYTESILEFNKLISHEIKTPLAEIQTDLDILKLENPQLETQNITKNIKQIKKIIDTLNKFILLENQTFAENKKLINLCDFFEKIIKSYEIQIKINCDKETKIKADPAILEILIKNLLENIKKYSKGANSLIIKNNKIIIKNLISQKITNTQKLKEKFVGEKKNGGLGLGLYIVNKICEIYGRNLKIFTKTYNQQTFFIIQISLG